MNRAFKIAGLVGLVGLVGVGAVVLVRAGLVVATVLREQYSDLGQPITASDLSESNLNKRHPSPQEFLLIEAAKQYGWPTEDQYFKFGTENSSPYLIFDFQGYEVRLEFTGQGYKDFRIAGHNAPNLELPKSANPAYAEIVTKFNAV